MKNKLTLSIKDFFTKMKLIKDAQELSVKDMDKQIEFIDKEINKAKITNQKYLEEKLQFNKEILERELEISKKSEEPVKFVWTDQLRMYIRAVNANHTKIVKLEDYERPIPDDIVDKIAYCKENNIYDKYVVVYNDLTSPENKNVVEANEKTRQEAKDPIVFGLFEKQLSLTSNDKLTIPGEKLYYIGEWVDDEFDISIEAIINSARNYDGDESYKDIVLEVEEVDHDE